jgi:tetratricopeptide (TPR) repeat protein
MLSMAMLLLCAPSLAEDIDDFREVSYLVFQKKNGFSAPKLEHDILDGSLEIRFDSMPKSWRGLLTPQVKSERKRRFFRNMEPIVEDGKTVGIRLVVGVGLFSADYYVKQRPKRWVLRVGEHRLPPFGPGPLAMPIVPYSEVIDIDAPEHDIFAQAERSLAAGGPEGCPTFTRLRRTKNELGEWATLREADCLSFSGDFEPAIKLLANLADTTDNRGIQLLASARIIELNGDVLVPRFDRSMYEYDRTNPEFAGTVGDELAYREIRALAMRREVNQAFHRWVELRQERPESPFLIDSPMLQNLGWRAIRDAAWDQDWLEVSKIYLSLPQLEKTDARWFDIQNIGANALRRVGASTQAVPIYMQLLKSRHPKVVETDTIVELAASYIEAKDAHRALVTLDFIAEQYPRLLRKHSVRRLRARLAKLKRQIRQQVAEAEALTSDLPISPEDEMIIVDASTATLRTDGVNAARRLLKDTRGVLAQEVARDLAMAAGDCDALVKRATPIEIATGDDLLWGAACLLGQGRLDEASVLLEAAQLWTTASVVDPDNAELIMSIEEHARWWLQQRNRMMTPNNPPGPRS